MKEDGIDKLIVEAQKEYRRLITRLRLLQEKIEELVKKRYN